MIYLASPYSHPDPLIMKTRFLLAEQVVGLCTSAGMHVYSPIVHYHEIARKIILPTDFNFWKSINFDMIRRADAVYVLNIEGVHESKGVKAETQFAKLCGMPIYGISDDGELSSWLA